MNFLCPVLAHVLIHAGSALILQKFVYFLIFFRLSTKSAAARKTRAVKIAQVLMRVRLEAALQVLLRISG